MRFALKQAGCGSERIGCLTGFINSAGTVIETPTSALFTQGASVVHLTAEVLGHVFTNPKLLWMPICNSLQLEPGVRVQGEGIAKFAGVPEHFTCFATNNLNEVTPAVHFEHELIPIWTKNGKKMITVDRYMDVMEVFKPNIILAIADSIVPLSATAKRISKSVERTKNMLEICVNRYKASKVLQDSSLIGVIVGINQKSRHEDSIQHAIKYSEYLSGFALSGVTDGTEESLNVPIEELEIGLKKADEALPKDKVRIIEGCWNPAVVVTAIEHGWDVFDGSYPVKLTGAGQALALNYDVDRNSDEHCILDLIDSRYKDDFRPISENCECLACKKHTRAYICHLLNTREMLSRVLISIHNLHHFDQLFHHARRHIASNTYQIFKRHITKQYESYKSVQLSNTKIENVREAKVEPNTQQNGEEINSTCQIKKKTRVSNSRDNVVNGPK